MARRIVTTLALVVGLSAFASPIQASDATFPIGLWLSDSAAGGGGQYGLSVQSLAALRWQGINVGTAGGSVRKCQNKLARYDSLGYRIWLAADTFHWSNPNVTPPVHNLDIAGRDDLFTDTMDQYFISHGYSNPTPLFYYSKSSFDTYLNNMVSSVVDSVKNCHALWKYFYWDEPNNEHSIYADTTWKEFWENI